MSASISTTQLKSFTADEWESLKTDALAVTKTALEKRFVLYDTAHKNKALLSKSVQILNKSENIIRFNGKAKLLSKVCDDFLIQKEINSSCKPLKTTRLLNTPSGVLAAAIVVLIYNQNHTLFLMDSNVNYKSKSWVSALLLIADTFPDRDFCLPHYVSMKHLYLDRLLEEIKPKRFTEIHL